MKTNFLKNSLSAFAFTLAIIAYFAFSSTKDDQSLKGYQQESALICTDIGDVSNVCEIALLGPTCTINGKIVYKNSNGATCSFELKQYP